MANARSVEDIFQLGIKVLIVDQSTDSVLLLKIDTTNYAGTPDPYWDLPGGRVSRGESVVQTLTREVAEETGIGELPILTLLTTIVSNIRIPYQDTDAGLLLQVYISKFTQRPQVQLSQEHTDFAWVSYVEAANRLRVKFPQSFCDELQTGKLI